MSDLSSGQAIRFAQNPLPNWIGKVRPSGIPARPSTTPRLISSDSEGTPSVSLERQLSNRLREGYVLGLDPGAKVSGFAVLDPRTQTIVAMGELHLRQDIKGRMDSRRQYRRTRRSRKWYRPKRFDNRTRDDGWLPPTMQSKIAAHLHLIKWLSRQYPISTIIIEQGQFDLHAMKNGYKLAGWQYQRGEQYGFENVAQMVRIRDDYTCQACLIDYERRTGKKARGKAYAQIRERTRKRGIEVGHLTARSRGGTNVPGNLVVLCHDHNATQGTQSIEEFGYPELRKQNKANLKWASHVNIYVPALMDKLKDDYSVLLTRGFITKVNRQALGLPKEHYYDAAVIASQGEEINGWPRDWLRTRWMGRKRRQRYKANFVKGGKLVPFSPNPKKDGFQTGDYVLYEKKGRKEYGFIQSIFSKGNARIVSARGAKDVKGVWSLKYLTLIQRSPRLRYEFCPVPYQHSAPARTAERQETDENRAIYAEVI